MVVDEKPRRFPFIYSKVRVSRSTSNQPDFWTDLLFTHNHIHHHDGHNDGEGYAERRIGIEKIAIKAKADGPNQEFQDAYTFFLVVFMDKK